MTIRHDYLLAALAMVLAVTNCLGATLTIKRNHVKQDNRTKTAQISPEVSFGWATTYGCLALAQGVSVTLAVIATAITFSHSLVEWIQSLYTGL